MKKLIVVLLLCIVAFASNAQTKSNQYITASYFGEAYNPFEDRWTHIIEFTNNTSDQSFEIMIECDGNVQYYYVTQYQFAGSIDYNPANPQSKKIKITVVSVPNSPTLTLTINNPIRKF